MNTWSPNRAVEKAKPKPLALDPQTAASVNYPAFVLPTGERLHLYREGNEWHIWLNTEAADFDGLCLAVSPALCDTIHDAKAVAQALLDVLTQLSSPSSDAPVAASSHDAAIEIRSLSGGTDDRTK